MKKRNASTRNENIFVYLWIALTGLLGTVLGVCLFVTNDVYRGIAWLILIIFALLVLTFLIISRNIIKKVVK